MPALDTAVIVLGGIAFFAAFVNGAIGYGFSSLTVPLALVFFANRVLNPAIVLIEVFLNLYVLFINRDGIFAVWRSNLRNVYVDWPAWRAECFTGTDATLVVAQESRTSRFTCGL